MPSQFFGRIQSIHYHTTKRLTAPPRLRRTDHCPFCVRVRLAAGLLGIKHNLQFMANDDIPTPTALIGKKIAPIWVDEDGPMMESLDIIEKIDTGKVLKPASGRTDLKAWQKSVQTLLRKLQRPRYVMVPLPEFMQKDGRDAFVANHQMPPFEKKDWKGAADFPIEKKYGYYEEAFGQTAELLPELNKALLELEPRSLPASAAPTAAARAASRTTTHRPVGAHSARSPSSRASSSRRKGARVPRQLRDEGRRPAVRHWPSERDWRVESG